MFRHAFCFLVLASSLSMTDSAVLFAEDAKETVVKVVHSRGNFDQVGYNEWKETLDGRTGMFREDSRDTDIINLVKETNGVRVVLNLSEMAVYYGEKGVSPFFLDQSKKKKLYDIKSTLKVSRQPLKSGSYIYLRSRGSSEVDLGDKLFVGEAYSGNSYYYPYPRIASEAEKFKISLLGEGAAALKSGDETTLQATATSSWKSGWGSYNLLGAFEGGVYYWISYGDKTTWIIYKSTDSMVMADGKQKETIYYGDLVYLKNKAYTNGYLQSEDGKLNSTYFADPGLTAWYVLDKASPWWKH